MTGRRRGLTLSHWGAYELETDGTDVLAVHPLPDDPDPSPIGRSFDAVRRSRVLRPSIRRSWLESGPGSRTDLRGAEPFVEVDWDTALDLVAVELDRVRTVHGNESIYGGSYGWGSAGRFHHAQSQIHRFLAMAGGYTGSVDTYSHAAGSVIVRHVVGHPFEWLQDGATSWPVLAEHCDLFVAFGGVPRKNAQVQYGGQGRHTLMEWMLRCRERGTRFVSVSPLRSDVDPEIDHEWLPIRPNTDVALVLGLLHTLFAEGLADEEFLERYTVGWRPLRDHVLGREDGVARDAAWAAGVTAVDVDRIRTLAREMAAGRTMVNASWSLQRAHHGEMTHWATIALAAALGQIGLPGGGFALGYGAVGSVGNGVPRVPLPRIGRPSHPVETFIPVARIADMLLQPGEAFTYDGATRRYPDIRLVYWAGGNPFHHHQDLNRLARAWQEPETVVVHEPFWTPLAKRADVVLPVTTPLEREDIGGGSPDDHLFWMSRLIDPVGEARDDHAVFAGIADRLGFGAAFTGGRSIREWIEAMYEEYRDRVPSAPDFDTFRRGGFVRHPEDPARPSRLVLLDRFRADPDADALPTPSGRIELWSETIAGFALDDCPPHPAWLEPAEWLGGDTGRHPLHLLTHQPDRRLHSQWDHGETSLAGKVHGREPIVLHPSDAAARGVADGDVVLVRNERGACLAGAVVDDGVFPGVVVMPTGAWWDPLDPGDPATPCVHGNPNVLTMDIGTSSLAQGPSPQTCLVEVERFEGTLPPVRAFDPPELVRTDPGG